jgi:glycosyltransferase involved in cell wall biosynthesis
MMRLSRGWIAFILIVLLVVLGGLAGLQVMGALATRDMVRDAIEAPIGPAEADIAREKDRQEAIGKRIENRSKALLQVNLASALGAGLGILISASGAVLAIFTYLSAREKELADRRQAEEKDRVDRRMAQEKDRQDRFGAALSETLSRLVGQEARQRAVGAAGLLPFFTLERADFHLQALSALVAAARVKDEPPEVQQGLRLALEEAARTVAPDLLRKLSWQGVRVSSLNLARCNLSGLDLRDAELQDANLEGAILDGADLTNAKLQGARMGRAHLAAANLSYADLAGASLAGAVLEDCALDGVKVLNLELDKADLSKIGEGWRSVPWDATRDWRKATFSPEVRAELEARYGAEAPDLHVVMLMWEAPPYVAGGTWTACYHLVRRLRRRGARLTVVIPWARALIDDTPFGLDVPIVALGIVPPAAGPTSVYGGGSAYGGPPAWSVYGGSPAWSVYGGGAPAWSVYGGGAPPWSPYGSAGGYSGGGPYGGPYGAGSAYGGPYGVYGGGGLAGSVLFRLIGEFRRRLAVEIETLKPDVIHAHDWVTFDAARAASEQTGAPWVAHFHSTEADRRPTAPDELTRQIEGVGANTADALVVPSKATRQRLVAEWGARAERAQVAPNLLSDDPPSAAEMGRFETRRVVFVGRLSEQKGLDRFGEVAERARAAMPGLSFEVFGEGEEQWQVWRYGLNLRGALPWVRRGEAFAGASLAIVPSRSEPFGMVILEAMQHRTPVIYPAQSGAAEVLESGVKVDPADIEVMAAKAVQLLSDLGEWETVVRAQAVEIDAYPRRPDDDRLIAVWRQAVAESPPARAPSPAS